MAQMFDKQIFDESKLHCQFSPVNTYTFAIKQKEFKRLYNMANARARSATYNYKLVDNINNIITIYHSILQSIIDPESWLA